ncbi:hypothetical protein [Nocardioides sp.]|uniref:hypothetical protein n=1 Tax=Nocardioides sp. TaxID=35761 RepID=UPI0031FEF36A|nr:hypothetical protein [Nocardioides sp.]
MLRRVLLLASLLLLVLVGGGVAVARSTPSLSTAGPTSVAGTEASATFRIGEHLVRQIRYADAGTLRYTFRLTNGGRLPLTVVGLAAEQPDTRLFTYVSLTSADGASHIALGGGESEDVTLSLLMGGCESLSARAGAFVTEVVLRTRQAGMFEDEVTVTLPEEVHTGSPREAFCPNSTATSRPPG